MSEVMETKGRADNIDKLVSKRLKNRRVMLGLSQQELGEAVGVSIQQIQKYEKATNRISSGKLYSFAKFLKVPVNFFFDASSNSTNQVAETFAEESEGYETQKTNNLSEREVVSLVRAFNDIKNSQTRKKLLDLMKTIS